jgi:hypothetical protein
LTQRLPIGQFKSITTFLVYVPIANSIYEWIIDLLTKSIHYRNLSKLATKWYNFTKPSEILTYILLLAKEYANLSNLGTINDMNTLTDKHRLYYEAYYNYFKGLNQGDEYDLKNYFKFINPLYSFNVLHCHQITQCSYRHSNQGVVFVPYLDSFKDLIHYDI